MKQLVYTIIAASLALGSATASAVNVPVGGTLTSSVFSAPAIDNTLILGAATSGYNFSDATGSFSSTVSANGFYYTDYLFSFTPSSNLESAAVTLNNTSGVSGLSERIYAYTGSFLGDASASGFSLQGWTASFGGFSVSNIAPNLLAGGQYVLEIRGTNQGNFGGSLSLTPVPEPETYATTLAGLALLGCIARRRKSRATA
jgi:hypothetical protein